MGTDSWQLLFARRCCPNHAGGPTPNHPPDSLAPPLPPCTRRRRCPMPPLWPCPRCPPPSPPPPPPCPLPPLLPSPSPPPCLSSLPPPSAFAPPLLASPPPRAPNPCAQNAKKRAAKNRD